MPALYNGQIFRTELEATWAAFFDLAGWKWQVNPAPVENWAPDFRVSFPCGHSECGGSHSLLIAVLPVKSIEAFTSHPCLFYKYGSNLETQDPISEDAGAAFGLEPNVTYWEMSHGSGGGSENVHNWVEGDANVLWRKAKGIVMNLSQA